MTYILLVEDDEMNRTVIEDMAEFDELPAALECVGSGEEAIKRVEKSPPLLVLMDVGLPGIDGLETTRRLHQLPQCRDLPVWALTAHAMKGDEQKTLDAGCLAHITKPIDRKEFKARLDEFLSAKQAKETHSC